MSSVAIYARISKNDANIPKVEIQAQQVGIALIQNNDHEVIGIYSDDGISASKGALRPQFERLLADIKSGKVDVVLATAQDRLTRTIEDLVRLCDACKIHGTKLHTIRNGQRDPGNPEDKFLMVLDAGLAGREVGVNGDRMTKANIARRTAGKPTTGPRRFGFEKDRVHHRKNEADWIRWATDEVLNGVKPYAILQETRRRGYKTARCTLHSKSPKRGDGTHLVSECTEKNFKGGEFEHSTIRRTLMNPANAGRLTHKGEDVGEGKWKPIVSVEKWEAVCAILKSSSRAAPERKPKWLSSGHAKCGACGMTMRSASSTDRTTGETLPYYRCNSTTDGRTNSPIRHAMIRIDVLDAAVRDAVISAYLTGPRHLLPMDVEFADLVAVRAQRAKLQQDRENILDLMQGGSITMAVAKPRLDRIAIDDDSLATRIEEAAQTSAQTAMLLEVQAELWNGKEINFEDAAKAKAALATRFDSLTVLQQRTLVRALLDITVNRGRGEKKIGITQRFVQSLNADDASNDVVA